jgi:hypothetical protein
MISIDSKLWSVRTNAGGVMTITQRATGVSRAFGRTSLPPDARLAAMNETQFDAACRRVFHYEKRENR